MKNNKPMSLFQYISAAATDGKLPEHFSLPKPKDDEKPIPWADGAKDGVAIYHMGVSEMSAEDQALMEEAVHAASAHEFDRADELFVRLGKNRSAIAGIDPLQTYIVDRKEELGVKNVFEYGFHALVDSEDRECVKYGLSLLELFDTDPYDEIKEAVRIIGLSDEFALFAIFVMLRWKDGNQEVWQLAKKIRGWGRVHAVERIEPETDEIKRWFLLEAVSNDVIPAYSAFTCWQKADAEAVLRNHPSKEEFAGIRDIIAGMLDEGPVPGISRVKNRDDVILTFLRTAEEMALEPEDYETIRSIRIYFEEETSGHPEILPLCQKLLTTDPEEKVKARTDGLTDLSFSCRK